MLKRSKSKENQHALWQERATKYNQLEWVSKSNILQGLSIIGDFKSHHKVLDVGCGTGKVAHTVAPYVQEVHGIDFSSEMISQIDTQQFPNIFPKEASASNLPYPDNSFDRVTARLVLHHITDSKEMDDTLQEIKRVLKPDGKFIISEGVPPSAELKPDFEEIFKLKESRITFLPEDLTYLLRKNGFKNIRVNTIIDEHMSVRNWLENAGNLSQEDINKIYSLHKNARALFKESYNLRDLGHDIFIDVKVAIITGENHSD
jgi:ubiquinone/menaquinone biosynthesis C-methylase UbiE